MPKKRLLVCGCVFFGVKIDGLFRFMEEINTIFK